MAGLRTIDRVLLLTLGPLWVLVFALALISVERPVVALPFYTSPAAGGDSLPEVTGIPSWARPPGQEADVRSGDRLRSVGGTPVAGAGRLRVAALAWAAMDDAGRVPVEIERDGRSLDGAGVMRAVAPRWPALAVSLVFGAFGIGVLLSAPRRRLAQVSFPALLCTALWLGGQFGTTPFENLAAFVVRMAALTFLLPLAVRSLRFYPDGTDRAVAWARGWPALLALQGVLAVNAELGLGLPPLLRDATPKLLSLALLGLALGVGTLNYRATGPVGRRRFKWLILGVYVAYLPPTTVSALSAFRPELGAWFIPSQLALLALPLTVTLGAWRDDLFDIDRALNATLVFMGLGAVGLGLLVVAVPPVALRLADGTGLGPNAARTVLDAGVLLALAPAALALRAGLDRIVLRGQLDRERGVRALRGKLDAACKLQEVAALLGDRLPRIWGAEGAVVWAESTEGFAPIYVGGDGPGIETPPPVERLSSARGPAPDANGGLWLPVVAAGSGRGSARLLAAVGLGPRRSGDDWGPGERALLTSVADAAALRLVALEHADRLREARAMTAALTRERDAAALDSREKTTFLATASHDLRQPLHALGLFVGALQQRIHDPEARELVGNVEASARSLGQLFEALLDVTRLDAGVLQVEPEDGVRLAPLFEDLVRELGPVAAARGLKLRSASTSLAVRSDPALLRSIVQNLVANAVRYTERGGVLLGARRRGDAVVVEVWDTGPGIDAAQRDALFEAWRRGDAPPESTGTGLGLSIVERLSRLLDHQVGVASRPGRGSVFSVTLPRTRPSPTRARSAKDAAGFSGLRVWVVDDDPGAREGLRALLAAWGIEVVAAADAGEALRAGTGAPPDALLADLHLAGGASGVDAVAEIRSALGTPVPACLITAESRPATLADARVSGLPVLRKPVEPVRLRAALMHLLESRGTAGTPS